MFFEGGAFGLKSVEKKIALESVKCGSRVLFNFVELFLNECDVSVFFNGIISFVARSRVESYKFVELGWSIELIGCESFGLFSQAWFFNGVNHTTVPR